MTITHNGVIAVKPCQLHGWFLASRDGWWPIDQIDIETLTWLQKFVKDERLPEGFRKHLSAMWRKNNPHQRMAEYPHMPLLAGVNLKQLSTQ